MKLKVNRFKIELANDSDIIKEIDLAIKTYKNLKVIAYIKPIAQALGLKEFELMRVINDLDLKFQKGRKTGKIILLVNEK